MKKPAERELREQLDKLEKRIRELESRPVFVPQPYQPYIITYGPTTCGVDSVTGSSAGLAPLMNS